MADKIKIDKNAFVYPMPMVMVGALVDGRANFLACAWVSRVNYKPPMIAVSLGNKHFTNKGILEHKTFSINTPNDKLLSRTDYCGIASGRSVDKSQLFTVFYGELKTAPMIQESPLTMECSLEKTVELEEDTLFIGRIVNAYSEQRYLRDGKPDLRKIRPFVLTMPDNAYWAVGKKVGDAWNIGRRIRVEKCSG